MKFELTKNNWLTKEGIYEIKRKLDLFFNSDTEECKALDHFEKNSFEENMWFGSCLEIFEILKKYNSLNIKFEKYVNCNSEDGHLSIKTEITITSFEELEDILTIKGFIKSDFNTIINI